jgi:transcription-repair coupling factor (superfamily II helicase)
LKKLEQSAETEIAVTGLAGSSPGILLANISKDIPRPIIAIVSSPEEANDLFDDLSFLEGDENVCHFPSLQVPPYEFRPAAAEIAARRLSTLARLKRNDVKIVVAPIAAVIEPTTSAASFEEASLMLGVGDEVDIQSLAEKLVRMGFRRVPLVEEVGDFSLRGGLVDFF